MKPTKTNTTSYVKMMLATNPAWAVKALVRIYQENQTSEEQAAEVTNQDNGIGFTGTDAGILSSFANFYLRTGRLSDKQMAILLKKMPKYHKQVIAMSDSAKLESMVSTLPEVPVTESPKIYTSNRQYLREKFGSECE